MTQVHERRALVGPELYPSYVIVLKIALAAVVGSILCMGIVKATLSGGGDRLLDAIGIAWNGAFVAIGAVTLVFTLAERNAVARARLLEGLAPLHRPRPLRRGAPRWTLRLAAIAAQGLFLLWWTGATGPWGAIPLSAGGQLRVDPGPAWAGLFWPVLGLSVAVIVVNGLRLAAAPGRRLDHGLDLVLQLGVLAVAVAALRADGWVSVSGYGMAPGAVMAAGLGLNLMAQAALVAIACVAVCLSGFHAWGMIRGEALARGGWGRA